MTGQVIDDWDDEVPVVAAATVYEDDEVLDDWDAEEKVVEMAPAKVEIPKKSKPVKKETLIHEDMYVNESEADRKKRIEEAVRIRDLESAMSLFGVDSVTDEGATAVKERNTVKINASHFDTMNPNTLTEFDQFSKIIVQRLQTFEVSS